MDKAEENLNKSLEISQMEPFVLFLLGNIYSRRGRISEAVDCYETAIFLDFDMYVAHIDFARKYEHMGRHKKALREYKAALEIDSRDEGLLEKINYIEKKCKMTKACDFEKEEQNHLINDQLALNLIYRVVLIYDNFFYCLKIDKLIELMEEKW